VRQTYGYQLVRAVTVGEREIDGQRVPIEDRVERWPLVREDRAYWILLEGACDGQAAKATTFYSKKAALQRFDRLQRERAGL
jgi:hypothetical protein